MILPLKHPFSMIVAGPSGCGKTFFTVQLVNNLGDCIEKVLWCHAESNAIPQNIKFKNIIFHQGIPDEFENFENKPILVVLDDFMLEGNSARVCELFTKGSHHRNMSVILLTQNLFHKGGFTRDISLNSNYIICFKNPRDKTQFSHFARQVYPESPLELCRVYKEITQQPHGYLFVDLTQDIHELLRFRTDIFNPEFCTCFCSDIGCEDVTPETFEGERAYALCAKASIP